MNKEQFTKQFNNEKEFLDSIDLLEFLVDRKEIYDVKNEIKKRYDKEFCKQYNDDYGLFNCFGTDELIDYITQRYYPDITFDESINYYVNIKTSTLYNKETISKFKNLIDDRGK